MNYFFTILFLILFIWNWRKVKLIKNMSTNDLIRAGVDTIVYLILIFMNIANLWRAEA